MKRISFPILLKKLLPLIYVSALALTLLIVYLGYSTSRQTQEIISNQFNQQQLILARKISDHIQNQISHLQKSLLAIRETWQVNKTTTGQAAKEILWEYHQLLSGDVLSLMVLDDKGHPVWRIQDPSWKPQEIPLPELKALEPYLPTPISPNRIWIGHTFSLGGEWVLPMMIPLPFSKDQGTGVRGAIVFILDAIQIVKKATFGVVSGSTGYAWVINPQGILFDHFESEFVGRSIFEVRKARNPRLSYKVIDDLTRQELLQKKEGMARYISGWHRSRLSQDGKIDRLHPDPVLRNAGAPRATAAFAGRRILVGGPGGPHRRGLRIDPQSKYPAVPIDRYLPIADYLRHRDVGLYLQSLVQYLDH